MCLVFIIGGSPRSDFLIAERSRARGIIRSRAKSIIQRITHFIFNWGEGNDGYNRTPPPPPYRPRGPHGPRALDESGLEGPAESGSEELEEHGQWH